jgi:hypothetical protein
VKRLAMILIAMTMLMAACSDDAPSTATIDFGSGSATTAAGARLGSGAEYSTFIRDSYLEGCETEQNSAFCECTLTELERIFSEDEFIRFAIETTEEMPPEAIEIAIACIDEIDLGAPGSTTAPAVVPSQMMSVFDLQVGDCFDDQGIDAEQTEVPVVDCSLPHDNELYFEYAMTDAVFPGNDAAMDASFQQCTATFDAFVGLPYADSALDVFPITPTAESWAAGDRTVFCVLYNLDLAKMEGTMAGSRR